MSKTSAENLAELLELMKAHPELPVLPMVWGEIALEENRYWTASWQEAQVTKYLITDDGVFFYDEKDMDDCIYSTFTGDDPESLSDEALLEFYRSLPWKDAIVVYIGMPEAEP